MSMIRTLSRQIHAEHWEERRQHRAQVKLERERRKVRRGEQAVAAVSAPAQVATKSPRLGPLAGRIPRRISRRGTDR
jgi:hypothetical protein